MTAHALFAPSSSRRWLRCPHSAVLAADVPDRENEQAAEGTRVHKLVEDALRGRGMPAPNDPGAHAVNLVLDYVRQLGPGDLYAEHRTMLSADVWGTVDITHMTPQVGTVIDYKNGAYDVPARENEQLLTYCAGERQKYPNVPWWRIVVVQPNSRTAGDVAPVKQDVVSAAQVEAHAERVADAVHRAKAGEGPQPGDHCRWCPAFGKCTATQSMLDFISEAVKMPADQLPDAALVRTLQVLRGFEDFRKLVDAELLRRLSEGRAVPGATLGAGRSFRAWRDDIMATQALQAAFGAMGVKPISPAEAEKLGGRGKAIAKALAFKAPGKPTPKY